MVLTLYKMDFSPPVRAVLMTIEALKIPDVNYIDINPFEGDQFKEEYIKMNPQHTIPTLLDDDFAIWDSHAIGSYLISTYGENDSLYPKDPKKRALVDQRLHFDSGILFPALRGVSDRVLILGEKSFSEVPLSKIQSAYDVTEKFLTSSWLAGDEITLADICCVSTISTMNIILPIDKDRYVNLWGWLRRCSQLDIYKIMNEPGLKQCKDLIASKMG